MKYQRLETLLDIRKFTKVLIAQCDPLIQYGQVCGSDLKTMGKFTDIYYSNPTYISSYDLVKFPGHKINGKEDYIMVEQLFMFGTDDYSFIKELLHKEAPMWFKRKYGVYIFDKLRVEIREWAENSKSLLDKLSIVGMNWNYISDLWFQEYYISRFNKGIILLRKLRLHYLVYSLWHHYWYDQRDENGHSRACKYVAQQLTS